MAFLEALSHCRRKEEKGVHVGETGGKGRTYSATPHRERQETSHSPIPGGYLKLCCLLGGGDVLSDVIGSASAFKAVSSNVLFLASKICVEGW